MYAPGKILQVGGGTWSNGGGPAGARAAFGLPYRWARMRHQVRAAATGDVHAYDTRLRHPGKRAHSHIVVRAGAIRLRAVNLFGHVVDRKVINP